MIFEALALFALWKLATRSSKKKVLVRHRRPRDISNAVQSAYSRMTPYKRSWSWRPPS